MLPDPILLLKFAIGSFIMRGAGCTINDMWDKDIDKHIERTKSRPLASGIISNRNAFAFLCFQLVGGLSILVTFNYSSIVLGFMAMPLVGIDN